MNNISNWYLQEFVDVVASTHIQLMSSYPLLIFLRPKHSCNCWKDVVLNKIKEALYVEMLADIVMRPV